MLMSGVEMISSVANTRAFFPTGIHQHSRTGISMLIQTLASLSARQGREHFGWARFPSASVALSLTLRTWLSLHMEYGNLEAPYS